LYASTRLRYVCVDPRPSTRRLRDGVGGRHLDLGRRVDLLREGVDLAAVRRDDVAGRVEDDADLDVCVEIGRDIASMAYEAFEPTPSPRRSQVEGFATDAGHGPADMAEVSKHAQPPQQQPTTPNDVAPSFFAYAKRLFTFASMPSHLTFTTHFMKSSPRSPRSNVGGRPSPSVPPSNAGCRTLGTYVR